jgi:hypothetical protein
MGAFPTLNSFVTVCVCVHLCVLRGGGRLIRGAVGHRQAGEEA